MKTFVIMTKTSGYTNTYPSVSNAGKRLIRANHYVVDVNGALDFYVFDRDAFAGKRRIATFAPNSWDSVQEELDNG